MREFITEGVILDKEPSGDVDGRFFIFSKKFGKIIAKARGVRRITSKLSSHLEPGNVVWLRLVQKNSFQIADALKKEKLNIIISDLYFLNQLLIEGEEEKKIWPLLFESKLNWRKVLKILGWDPEVASCFICEKINPLFFNVKSQNFFCKECSLKVDSNELIYISYNI